MSIRTRARISRAMPILFLLSNFRQKRFEIHFIASRAKYINLIVPINAYFTVHCLKLSLEPIRAYFKIFSVFLTSKFLLLLYIVIFFYFLTEFMFEACHKYVGPKSRFSKSNITIKSKFFLHIIPFKRMFSEGFSRKV